MTKLTNKLYILKLGKQVCNEVFKYEIINWLTFNNNYLTKILLSLEKIENK